MNRMVFSYLARVCAAVALSTIATLPVQAQSFVYTNNSTTPNSVSGFSIAADGSLVSVPGSPFLTGGSGRNGGDLTITAVGNYLYVNDGDSISGFSIDPATGVLTQVAGSPFSDQVSALAPTPDGKFLIAMQSDSDEASVYAISGQGVLIPVLGSPFAIGTGGGINITPDGKFLLVVSGGSVGVFNISADGELSAVTDSPFLLHPTRTGSSVISLRSGDVDCSSTFAVLRGVVGVPSPGGLIEEVSITAGGAVSLSTNPHFRVGFGFREFVNDLVLSPDGKNLFLSYFGNRSGVRSFGFGGGVTDFNLFQLNIQDSLSGLATNRAGSYLYVAGTTSIYGFAIGSGGALTSLPGSPFLNTGFSGFQSHTLAVFPPKACAQIVNDKVSFVVQSKSLDPAPAPGGPAGVYTITARLTNKSQQDIFLPLNAVVTVLTNGNVLLSATDGDGVVGSRQAISAGADEKLSPGESATVEFRIGLANRSPFSFFLDVSGIP